MLGKVNTTSFLGTAYASRDFCQKRMDEDNRSRTIGQHLSEENPSTL